MNTQPTTDTRNQGVVYIDGFNWYHAIFRHRSEWKWLNLQTFFEWLRRGENVVSIKFFSALIDQPNSDARDRQQRYLRALETLPKVSVILGVFQERTVKCRACGQPYSVPEEKKTDVNIAVEIISDAISEQVTRMTIVSGDSDIQPAVEWVVRNRPNIRVTVYIPALPPEQGGRRTDYYRTKRLPVGCYFLPLDHFDKHQLPAVVHLADGTMAVRPHIWQAPHRANTGS